MTDRPTAIEEPPAAPPSPGSRAAHARAAEALPRGRLAGVALVSAAVLLLQLVQTRIFSVMLWHHLTYLVVTFTMLGFAAGGAVLACRPGWLRGDTSARAARFALLFAISAVAVYALITRAMPQTSHSRAGIATAAIQYGVLVLPMVFGGLVVALALSDARGAMGRTYAWNMGGSGLGCALYVPVLRGFGGEGAVLFATAVACIGAAALAWGSCAGAVAAPAGAAAHRGRPPGGSGAPGAASDGSPAGAVPRGGGRLVALSGALAAVLLLVASAAPTAFFEVPIAASKAMSQTMELARRDPAAPDLVVEETHWDPVCRLDVVGPGPTQPKATRTIYQDGDAPTVLPLGPAHRLANIGEKEGLAYLLFRHRPPKVLAIGIGGGIDILQAKATARTFPDGGEVDFTGVEINATTVGLMRGPYSEATAHRYTLPGVSIHVDEGRSWLRRSDETYDIIQMTGTDTYAALSSGSYVMSESYLYTVDAYDDFLAHLTDDGVIAVLRFRFEPPRETLRLAAIAVESLRRAGAPSPADHVILVGIEGGKVELPDGRTVGLDYGMLLVGKQPFEADEVRTYRQLCDFHPSYFLMYAPGVETTGPTADYFAAVRAGTDADFRARYLYKIDPVTDDAPFFFRYHRWSNVSNVLFGSGGAGGAPLSRTAGPEGDGAQEPRAAVGSDGDGAQSIGEEYSGIVGGEPIALIMLLTVLLESVGGVGLLVLVPLLIFRREGLRAPRAGSWLLYFGGLGAGYMLVEIAAMQRFVLFLGHPSYAISVVLISFLVFSALGSAVAGRSSEPARTLVTALVGVLVLVGALALGLGAFFDAALTLPLPARIALTVVVLAPVAFVMGMPFPSGLSLVSGRAAPMVPWAFGVNGGASVVASVAGILVAMASGFSMAFAVAAAAYAVALLVGLAERRRVAAGAGAGAT